MPWRKLGRGYTKKTKSGKPSGFVGNPKQYEKLREKGMSKERAARITNASKFHKADTTSAFGIDHG